MFYMSPCLEDGRRIGQCFSYKESRLRGFFLVEIPLYLMTPGLGIFVHLMM